MIRISSHDDPPFASRILFASASTPHAANPACFACCRRGSDLPFPIPSFGFLRPHPLRILLILCLYRIYRRDNALEKDGGTAVAGVLGRLTALTKLYLG